MCRITVLILLLLHHVHANPSNPSHGSCTYPTPPSTVPSPPPVIHDFLSPTFLRHFQQSYLHIPGKDRHHKWRNVVTSLTPSLEKILSANATTPGEGPLLLNFDLTLHKLDTETERRQRVERISDSSIVPPSVTSALDDGFSLTVHRLEHRMASLNTLTASLAQAFGVRVTADYTIHPEDTGPRISAQDEIHIIVSGTSTADIHEGVLRYAFDEHVNDDDVLTAFRDDDTSVTVALAEGDLLYLPRGDGLTVSSVTMLTIRLHTEEITHVDVLNAVIDVGSVEEDNPLTDSLPGSEGEYSYGDLLKELVKVAAEVTDELRKHFVVGDGVRAEDDDDDAVEIVSDVTERFMGAAHALYKPGLEVLSERDGIGAYLMGLTDESGVDDGFERCVQWLRARDLVEESVAEVFVKWFERRDVEEDVEIRRRWKSLEKYGESTEWVSFA